MLNGRLTPMTTTTPILQTYHIQFNFHFDETQRLLDLARALPEEVYRAEGGYSRDGMHNTFVHMLHASQLWRNVIADTLVPDFAKPIADIDALAALFEIERSGWHTLLARFDTETVFGAIERRSPKGTLVL